ncbi:hypothetical protein BpHYR1_013547 [Brachionus plicatilis]|uniref:Uncharacterized protein n=1 Tax=Brachionus plicatilis TaxID=10195 RepID=A0A3M7P722_BRAPC|nr:hypothetical protein BpHYR1_013547 [Brachionus plicatilis]
MNVPTATQRFFILYILKPEEGHLVETRRGNLIFIRKRIVKTFMLKLRENSDIWKIYCIRQPKKTI